MDEQINSKSSGPALKAVTSLFESLPENLALYTLFSALFLLAMKVMLNSIANKSLKRLEDKLDHAKFNRTHRWTAAYERESTVLDKLWSKVDDIYNRCGSQLAGESESNGPLSEVVRSLQTFTQKSEPFLTEKSVDIINEFVEEAFKTTKNPQNFENLKALRASLVEELRNRLIG